MGELPSKRRSLLISYFSLGLRFRTTIKEKLSTFNRYGESIFKDFILKSKRQAELLLEHPVVADVHATTVANIIALVFAAYLLLVLLL
jgi:hypothetical protein